MDPDLQEPVAEPLYALLGELLQLKGVLRLARRTLVSLLQLSCGRTISRQLSDTAHWLVSEAMLLAYLSSFKHSLWKEGKLREGAPARGEEERGRTKALARQVVQDNLPDMLVSLVGLHTAREAADRVLGLLQVQG